MMSRYVSVAASTVAGVLLVAVAVSLLRGQITPNGAALYDQVRGRARRGAIVVSPEMMEKSKLEALAREALSKAPAYLMELLVGTSDSDLRRSTRTTVPRAESEPNFSDTLSQLADAGGTMFSTPLARILAINGSALISVREPGRGQTTKPGVYEEVLGGGADPTLFVFHDTRYRLLTFGIPDYRLNQGLPLVVFLKASGGRPSCAACQELAAKFVKLTGAYTVRVEIRPDVWFASREFPLVFRFEPDESPVTYSELQGYVVPPKLDQYYRADHVMCDLRSIPSARFDCDGYGRYDQAP